MNSEKRKRVTVQTDLERLQKRTETDIEKNVLDKQIVECYNNQATFGEVSERFKELVLKTSDPFGSVGSNPTFSVWQIIYFLI